jgi:signal peptidase I
MGRTLRDLLVGRSAGRSVVRGLALAVVLLLGSQLLLTPVRAHGISMFPTYEEGQLLLVNRLAYRFGRPVRRGDVVAITLKGGAAVLVKRIIGLPGERVRIEAGQVLVNDRPLAEPYCRYRLPWDIQEADLGPDEVFVIGDNRAMLEKHHDFGRASISRILGRMIN